MAKDEFILLWGKKINPEFFSLPKPRKNKSKKKKQNKNDKRK